MQPIHHSQHNQGLWCAGWNGCCGDIHRCGQYPIDLLRLPLTVQNVQNNLKIKYRKTDNWIHLFEMHWQRYLQFKRDPKSHTGFAITICSSPLLKYWIPWLLSRQLHTKGHTSNPWKKCPQIGFTTMGEQLPIEIHYRSLLFKLLLFLFFAFASVFYPLRVLARVQIVTIWF